MAGRNTDSGDLFQHRVQQARFGTAPLAERMRPRGLDGIVGQEHLLARGRFLRDAIVAGHLPSLILWGPPGSGKTTLARALANEVEATFVEFSAVGGSIKEVRRIVEEAGDRLGMYSKRTILFVDEIHRFNKAQQDAFLPHVERGTVTLVGATTENPSFEINAPLLSRCKVVQLHPLEPEALWRILRNAVQDRSQGLGDLGLEVEDETLTAIAEASHGDARRALTTLEIAAELASGQQTPVVSLELVNESMQHRTLLYDKSGDAHYDTVSAFIKSMRGSDPDASLHYLARMLEAGEDPMFVCRRMVIFAAEDIGNADPMALVVANNVTDAVRFIGMPEAVLPMSQGVCYLATAPKSNTALRAYAAAKEDVSRHGPLPIPLQIRNAPTRLMKSLGYGGGYQYPHDFEGARVAQQYLPDVLAGRRYYRPSDRGFERKIIDRMAQAARDRRGASEDDPPED